ncbi:hypothetical protein GCM10010168_51230 [Actinoplanes ianthinogenes]|uniref:Uncharacterized protein n=1 Tax=Actinoplanes ianthinogenes TaxID=122358 RepID=A0ABM7M3E6_9ACTN|nr:hypothetical protein Aiant_68310 [Actinoplanes ianthinogenes]GGR26797.1 hypothetical protein GCM10010168_51230 [Actinoplanes ianthinogenes]
MNASSMIPAGSYGPHRGRDRAIGTSRGTWAGSGRKVGARGGRFGRKVGGSGTGTALRVSAGGNLDGVVEVAGRRR